MVALLVPIFAVHLDRRITTLRLDEAARRDVDGHFVVKPGRSVWLVAEPTLVGQEAV